MFTNERGYPPEARKGAAERVCMTLLRSCSEEALREFFLEHIGEIMATIEANLSKVEEDREMKDFTVNSDNFSPAFFFLLLSPSSLFLLPLISLFLPVLPGVPTCLKDLLLPVC